MKGRDNANNRRLMHRHVEGSVLKNGISEAVATEGRLSDCHVNGDRQRFVTHSTVEIELGRERRERHANPRYRDYLWSLNRGREEEGGEEKIKSEARFGGQKRRIQRCELPDLVIFILFS